MNPETTNAIKQSLAGFVEADYFIGFFMLFVWFAVYYILYQLTKRPFLKLLMAAIPLYLLARFLHIIHSQQYAIIIRYVRELIRFAAVAFETTGAWLGLRYLQKLWEEKEAREKNAQPLPSTGQSSDASGGGLP